jgi:hypothetical protein
MPYVQPNSTGNAGADDFTRKLFEALLQYKQGLGGFTPWLYPPAQQSPSVFQPYQPTGTPSPWAGWKRIVGTYTPPLAFPPTRGSYGTSPLDLGSIPALSKSAPVPV